MLVLLAKFSSYILWLYHPKGYFPFSFFSLHSNCWNFRKCNCEYFILTIVKCSYEYFFLTVASEKLGDTFCPLFSNNVFEKPKFNFKKDASFIIDIYNALHIFKFEQLKVLDIRIFRSFSLRFTPLRWEQKEFDKRMGKYC